MRARNLLFITTDQQRFDSLPCYGLDFVQAPNIERLAAEGTLFERCYTSAPVCVPCRAAWMTGQWPTTLGVLSNGQWLHDTTPVWPQHLSDAGVRTAAIGKMHFMPWDIMGGFDERVSAEDKRHTYLPDDHFKYLRSQGIRRPHPHELPEYFDSIGAPVTPGPHKHHVDGFTGDSAAEWLQQHGADPFAIWVSFAGPHDPYDPPQDMAGMYYDAPIPEPVGGPDELANKPKAQQKRTDSMGNSMFRIRPSDATPEQIRRWRAHYYANISLIDEGIGKILASLEAHGVLDDTMIVFTSDHGDALGDHGLSFKSYFYESMAHVPLIVRGPGVQAGVRCPSVVSGMDVVALFYEVFGVTPPETLQAVSPTPMLADATASTRDAVFCEIGGRAMVCDGRWKYAHYATGEAELYDLEQQPQEVDNLAGRAEHAAEEARLRARLLEHWLTNQSQQQIPTRRAQHPFRLALEEQYKRERGA